MAEKQVAEIAEDLLNLEDVDFDVEQDLASAVESRLQVAATRVLTAEESAKKYNERVFDLKKKVKEQNEVRKNLQQRFENQKEQHMKRLHNLQETFSAKENELKVLMKQIEDVKTKENAKILALDKECKELTARLSTGKDLEVQLNDQLEAIQTQINRIQKERKTKFKDLCCSTSQETMRRDELVSLTRIAQAEELKVSQELDTVSNQINELTKLIEAAHGAEMEVQAQVMNHEEQLRRERIETKEKSQKIEEQVDIFEELTQQISSLEQKRVFIQQEATQRERSAVDLETQIEDEKRATNDILERIKSLSKVTAEFATKTKSSSVKVSKREEYYNTLMNETKDLEHVNHSLRKTLECLQHELEQAQSTAMLTEDDATIIKAEAQTVEDHARLDQEEKSRKLEKLSRLKQSKATLAKLKQQRQQLCNRITEAETSILLLTEKVSTSKETTERLLQNKYSLESELKASTEKNKAILRTQRRAVKAKERESDYLWDKLEEALYIKS
mmetsp:Transcript_7993/g.9498  ORF Transcript_7993/g.9498 Transcript_7993/m.9498 type:complete len:504 (+) Transcript_7993:243-1754(+)|eukprot:CAMPEP_0204830794 /NCGR_PEP_ID=MMETSP1346-20131115/9282_1 /ASSEMBLY_ACC=CAM_ASM_000771 /TAXON_ID=215587 /ORGANISM="Aplanochytrium stocchinoi, Strain GSBS06" /LENGTH=503 /DNA_ID=CAMNT_0051961329 /DNA_START=198 /DNA_END=1709 /DNA_ORIENTATION=+